MIKREWAPPVAGSQDPWHPIEEPGGYSDELFCGDYLTEEAAQAAFAEIMAKLDLFSVHREVSGRYTAFRPGQDEGFRPRIDFVLVPKQRLLDRGWTTTIGVECKKPGSKVGRAVSQAIDYMWSVFDTGVGEEPLDAVFLWSLRPQDRAIGSVMTQQRIESVYASYYSQVCFAFSSANLIDKHVSGELRVKISNSGRKVGSR